MDGFAIIVSWALIGLWCLFYKVTKPDERHDWARTAMGLFIMAGAVVTVLEFLKVLR